MVTWLMTHVTQKGQGRDPNILRANYLENGWRQRLRSNGPPIGNGPLGFEWSCDRWRHVTQKGQGHDPTIFGAHYLDNGWRCGFGANGAPIGNDPLGIKWLRDRWRHVTQKGQGHDPNIFGAHYLDNMVGDYRKWLPGNQMVTWPMTSRDPERSRSWPQYA